MTETSKRDWLGNAALCILSALGFIFIPSLVAIVLNYIFKGALSYNVLSICGSIVYIIMMIIFYYKDLVKEWHTYIMTFKESLFTGFKYYFIGLLIMIFSNIVISFVIRDVSANENAVRDMLYHEPYLSMISIVLIAPLTEELLFRKSLSPLIKNKWLYALASALLFAGAHLLTGLDSFKLIHLLYLIPYGSLGFAFAIANRNTNSTFTSIILHSFHNFITGVLLLLVYSSGVL